MVRLVSFSLDNRCYALPLSTVDRVVRVVEITPLPKAPAIVLGIINVGGRILPVVNVRQRFHLPDRDIALRDQMILGKTGRRCVALVVDEVSRVTECQESEFIAGHEILPGMEGVHGVARLPDGMILIYDLHQFLSLEEESALDEALATIENRDE